MVLEWSGEVRNVIYSADGKSVTVVYRVTLHGTDAEVYLLTCLSIILGLLDDEFFRHCENLGED